MALLQVDDVNKEYDIAIKLFHFFYANEIEDFSNCIISIDGAIDIENNDEVLIDMPKELLIENVHDPIFAIVESTYSDLLDHLGDRSFFNEKAILTQVGEC